jgi:hypothetical protein
MMSAMPDLQQQTNTQGDHLIIDSGKVSVAAQDSVNVPVATQHTV